MKLREWDTLVARHEFLMHQNPDAGFSKVPPNILAAVKQRRLDLLADKKKGFKLYPKAFASTLDTLLQFERVHADILMRKFDQHQVFIDFDESSFDRNKFWFKFVLKGLSKGQPKLIPGDMIILNDNSNGPERCIIEEIEGDVVKFSEVEESSRNFHGLRFDISFHSSAVPVKRCSQNLSQISGLDRINLMLFEGRKLKMVLRTEQEPEPKPKIGIEATRTACLDGRLNKHCNELQKQAIMNIMEARCRPRLYILFGPPGTGKTATVVEAVAQIIQRQPDVKILICTQSNNCVDDLVQKLLLANCIKQKELIRLCSHNYFKQLKARQIEIPRLFTDERDSTLGKRVVVTTNLMTFHLKQKFDFVFMDEAGHANIPESLLPCSKVKGDGCFVLAGDPKQLGPVITSREAAEAGLGESLLQRMFSDKLYGQHRGSYNPKFITKLVQSYRCDPRLMQLNNERFYRGELLMTGKTPPIILKMLKIDKPLVFKRVNGRAERLIENYSPSWRNKMEAERCIELLFDLYMRGFTPDQIGIITYYSLQRATLRGLFEERLRKCEGDLNRRFGIKRNGSIEREFKGLKLVEQVNGFLNKKLDDFSNEKRSTSFDWHCKIDTVDAFQGNEREVIIISPVLLGSSGFLNDVKRFNVATSRAKWLTMVVGNPNLLLTNKTWRQLTKVAYVTN